MRSTIELRCLVLSAVNQGKGFSDENNAGFTWWPTVGVKYYVDWPTLGTYYLLSGYWKIMLLIRLAARKGVLNLNGYDRWFFLLNQNGMRLIPVRCTTSNRCINLKFAPATNLSSCAKVAASKAQISFYCRNKSFQKVSDFCSRNNYFSTEKLNKRTPKTAGPD